MPIDQVVQTRLANVRYIRIEPEPDTVTIIHEREQHPGEAPETPTLWPEEREDMVAMVRRVRTLESQADQQRLQCNGDLVKLTSEMKQLSATVGNLMKRAVVLEEFAAGLYEGAKHAALDTESEKS